VHKALSSIVAAATIGGVMAFAGPALANTNAPIAQTGGAEVVIPMMGSPLTVTVALDTTTGNITSVNLNPAAGFTATAVSPSRVRFEKGTDGATRLAINAKGNQLSVSVRSLKLDDLLGSGTWTGDVFGTGVKTAVPYTIGKDGSGNPTVAIGAVTPPAPIVAVVGAAKTGDHEDGKSASQTVTFTDNGFTVRLTISVSVETDDSAGTAKLRFTLSGRDIQRLPLLNLVGGHTWKGKLCDGTAASFAYTVNADGTLTAGAASPTADIKSGTLDGEHEDHSTPGINFLSATFSTGDSVRISLSVKGTDAALATKVHAADCGTPASDPTVNTPVSLKPNQGHGHGDGNGNGNGKDNGKHGGNND
jgi:hypothetical protein